MSWTLAHNLAVREASVKHCWPDMVVYAIGDQAHQAEASDHNPDSRGIVHAIDIMTETDSGHGGAAAKILAWLLSNPRDLQYVIHDRRIWGVNSGGWSGPGQAYTGPDPHTNHIHVSGRHGTVGKNAATGTGYDTAAEAMTPGGSPCTTSSTTEDNMPTAADVWSADVIPNTAADAKTNPTTKAAFALGDVRSRLISMGSVVAAQSKQIDALTAAVTTLAKSGTSIDTTAVVSAVDAVGKAESAAVTALQQQVSELQGKLAAAGGALAASG